MSFAQALKELRQEDRSRKVRSVRSKPVGRTKKVLPFRDERLLLVARGVTKTEPMPGPRCMGCEGPGQITSPKMLPTPEVDKRDSAIPAHVTTCNACYPQRQEIRDQMHRRTVAAIMRKLKEKREVLAA